MGHLVATITNNATLHDYRPHFGTIALVKLKPIGFLIHQR